MIEKQIMRDLVKEFEGAVDDDKENKKCYVLCCLCYCIYDSYNYI